MVRIGSQWIGEWRAGFCGMMGGLEGEFKSLVRTIFFMCVFYVRRYVCVSITRMN